MIQNFKKSLKGLILCLALAHSVNAWAGYYAKVIAISDGDTVKVLKDKHSLKIRLAYIDAPEMGQPYGKQSKKALSEMIFQKEVYVESVDTDVYNRVVATLYDAGQNVNLSMVKQGHAWVYYRHNKDQNLVAAQRYARENNLGLWRLPKTDQMPPWKWRKSRQKRK